MSAHTRTVTGTLEIIPAALDVGGVVGLWNGCTMYGGNYGQSEAALLARYRERNPEMVFTPVKGIPGRYTVTQTVTLTAQEALAAVLEMANSYMGEYGASSAEQFAYDILAAQAEGKEL